MTTGAEVGRDLKIPGRDLDGIHFAMDYLPQQNRRVSNEPIGNVAEILADGKHVVVIGGGDTGSDCIGTAFRQGAIRDATRNHAAPPDHENKGSPGRTGHSRCGLRPARPKARSATSPC